MSSLNNPPDAEGIVRAPRTNQFETLYRCSKCGKWSHAAQKPRTHKRWIREVDGLPPGVKVLEDNTGGYIGQDFVPGGWFVQCGPFDTFVAVPA